MPKEKLTMPPEKLPRRLGRGLDALFNSTPTVTPDEPQTALRDVPINSIRRNPFQPRKDFDPEQLKELRESLNISGLLQPVTVRRAADGGESYELIAGERRLRAAQELGWTTISAVVKELGDRELLALALIENLQRTDLNPIEEAEGYDRLVKEFGHTHQTVGAMVGRDRSTVANMLRILQLPAPVQQMVRDGALTVGHARPLLGLNDETKIVELARETVKKGLSAREIEQRVRESAYAKPTEGGKRKRGRPQKTDSRSSDIRSVEERLRRRLQTDVSVISSALNKGFIKVSFYSAEDLERLTALMGLVDSLQ
jgi:ParB family chromosome partitioning protein